VAGEYLVVEPDKVHMSTLCDHIFLPDYFLFVQWTSDLWQAGYPEVFVHKVDSESTDFELISQ